MNKKLSFVKSTLVKNFLALSALQVVNLILPFITLPYLARVLGVENYGVVVMIYSIMQLLFVINDYGFNLSATKEISLHRNNINKINTIFSSILIIKIVLLILSLIILLVLVNTIPLLYQNKLAYMLGFGMVIGQSFTPIWLFQGMEKMKYVTLVNLISKLTFTLLIFVVVKVSSDYIYVPLLYSIGFVIASIISLFFAYKQFGVSIKFVYWDDINEQLHNSTQYFYSRAAIAGYSSGNNFIVGLVLGEYFAGIFGVAEKLYMAIILVYSPLSEAIYPYMVKNKNLKLLKKIIIAVVIINISAICFVTFLSEHIVYFVFGDGFLESAKLLRYFCFLAFLTVPTIFMGFPFLGAFGYEKYANYSVVIGSIVHVLILILFYPFLSIYTMVMLLIFTQIIVFSVRAYGVNLLLKSNRVA